ncbi:glycosyltransferase family 61 protein [Hymenobacter sp. NBH84]|uniref:glycosyltransferase family 61 protein n=1 Tax=Hymenobacter sp. NBH84 TaxID=2596915 RepID=UPI001626DE6F|nr:glycosyltransferase family 61 protein [Hymenobacter sp. NBH84]QNE38423.1 glycosyltransferase family 61 protein [Hymenobacter sp. NBH84]
MLKTIIKKLVPVALLSKAYAHYNKLRINTIDKIVFPEKRFDEQDFFIKRDAYPFQITSVPKDHLDTRLQYQVNEYENWTQDEYLLVYKDECLIDPKYGWALAADRKLIYPSLGFSRVYYLQKPSLRMRHLLPETLPAHDVLVSLRDTGEENYYHFYNDILAKLFFLEEQLQLPYEVPLLIAETLYNRPYFQYFLQHPYLKNRNWVVQKPGEYIRSRKTYFCKPLTHTASYYARIRELVPVQDLVPVGSANRRIFITRSPKRGRYIENAAEIEAICRAEGFEVIDFDVMTLAQQIKLMREARYVVGIHGAGLVNMLFHGTQPMGLMELLPPGEFYPFHYMLMAAQLGYQYDGMIGEVAKSKYVNGFYINPVSFQKHMMDWLSLASARIKVQA